MSTTSSDPLAVCDRSRGRILEWYGAVVPPLPVRGRRPFHGNGVSIAATASGGCPPLVTWHGSPVSVTVVIVIVIVVVIVIVGTTC